jgi:hypothetical protein
MLVDVIEVGGLRSPAARPSPARSFCSLRCYEVVLM